jgi:hypothetical protein
VVIDARLRDLAERMLVAGVAQGSIVHAAFQGAAFCLMISCAIALARSGAVHVPGPAAGAAQDLPADRRALRRRGGAAGPAAGHHRHRPRPR